MTCITESRSEAIGAVVSLVISAAISFGYGGGAGGGGGRSLHHETVKIAASSISITTDFRRFRFANHRASYEVKRTSNHDNENRAAAIFIAPATAKLRAANSIAPAPPPDTSGCLASDNSHPSCVGSGAGDLRRRLD